MVECGFRGEASQIFDNCDKTQSPHDFGSDSGAKEASIYNNYMKGTLGTAGAANGNCEGIANYTSLKLKNGVCVYFGSNKILVDVNGNKKPNEGAKDQMALSIGSDGIQEDIKDAMTTTWIGAIELPPLNDCSQYGNCRSCNVQGCTECSYERSFINGGSCVDCGVANCAECNESGCTKCYPYYGVSNGSCVRCYTLTGDMNCTECNESGCTKCFNGYRLSNGVCEEI